jgi:hypothetical protein
MLFFNCRNFIVSVAMDIMNACKKKTAELDTTEARSHDNGSPGQDDYDRIDGGPQRAQVRGAARDRQEATEDHPIGLEEEDEENLTEAELR